VYTAGSTGAQAVVKHVVAAVAHRACVYCFAAVECCSRAGVDSSCTYSMTATCCTANTRRNRSHTDARQQLEQHTPQVLPPSNPFARVFVPAGEPPPELEAAVAFATEVAPALLWLLDTTTNSSTAATTATGTTATATSSATSSVQSNATSAEVARLQKEKQRLAEAQRSEAARADAAELAVAQLQQQLLAATASTTATVAVAVTATATAAANNSGAAANGTNDSPSNSTSVLAEEDCGGAESSDAAIVEEKPNSNSVISTSIANSLVDVVQQQQDSTSTDHSSTVFVSVATERAVLTEAAVQCELAAAEVAVAENGAVNTEPTLEAAAAVAAAEERAAAAHSEAKRLAEQVAELQAVITGMQQQQQQQQSLYTTPSDAVADAQYNDAPDATLLPEPAVGSSDVSEWIEAVDEASGQVYYVNTVTGESSWELPASWQQGGIASSNTVAATAGYSIEL
jgi:WW domain